MVHHQNGPKPGPPSFEQARSPRQRARAAGLDPNHWYAVEYDRAVKAGQVTEVQFWNTSIALFRTAEGELHAIENRCAHRQLKLSLGHVRGCDLVCQYHGWSYDGQGRVCEIPHELFGRSMPSFKIGSFPVRVRYGLIWVFPGDAQLASQRPLPEIPELEGARPWARLYVDFTWRAHHSMIIDNVSDFTHEYLHRRYRPFVGAELTHLDADADRVALGYRTQVGHGQFSRYFFDRNQIDMSAIELCYEYPYQWSNTGGMIKHWCFLLPIDERTTRVFFVFCFGRIKVPFLPLSFPRWMQSLVMKITRRLLFIPLLHEDGFAVEAEQRAYEQHYDAPLAELNPAVQQFQKLTIRKWEEYLERSAPNESAAGHSTVGPTT